MTLAAKRTHICILIHISFAIHLSFSCQLVGSFVYFMATWLCRGCPTPSMIYNIHREFLSKNLDFASYKPALKGEGSLQRAEHELLQLSNFSDLL